MYLALVYLILKQIHRYVDLLMSVKTTYHKNWRLSTIKRLIVNEERNWFKILKRTCPTCFKIKYHISMLKKKANCTIVKMFIRWNVTWQSSTFTRPVTCNKHVKFLFPSFMQTGTQMVACETRWYCCCCTMLVNNVRVATPYNNIPRNCFEPANK